MRKLLAVVVLAGAVCLAGCELLDIINDLFGGGVPDGTGGGGIGGVTFTRIIVEYAFGIEVMRRSEDPQLYPPTLEPWSLLASIGSIGQLAFDATTNTYTVETPQGSDPYVKMSIGLDASGSMIRDLVVERQMSHGLDAWERIDKIVAFDIPYDRVEGNSTFYRIDADNVSWIGLDRVDYKDWSKTVHTEQDPMYWVVDPSTMQGYFDADPDRYIEIEFQQ